MQHCNKRLSFQGLGFNPHLKRKERRKGRREEDIKSCIVVYTSTQEDIIPTEGQPELCSKTMSQKHNKTKTI
jgi:hypothetical protein